MSNDKEQNELLLTAYLDGELGQADTRRAEALLDDSQYSELFESWKANRSLLKSLPKYRLKDSFAEEVLAAAKIEADSDDTRSQVSLQESGSFSSQWRNVLGVVASLAALVLGFIYLMPDSTSGPVAGLLENEGSPLVSSVQSLGADNSEPDESGAISKLPVIEDASILNAEMLYSSRNSGNVKTVETKEILSWVNGSGATSSELKVLKITMPSSSEGLEKLKQVLAINQIEICKPLGESQLKIADDLVAEVKANLGFLYIASTDEQMRKAISDLTLKSQASIEPYRVSDRGDVQGSQDSLTPARQENHSESSAVSKGEPMDSKVSDELDKLDRWFGLVALTENSGQGKYLLLIDSAKE